MSNSPNKCNLIKGSQQKLLGTLASALTSIGCDKECQRNKAIEELSQIVQKSTADLKVANLNIKDNTKKYFIAKYGADAYDNMINSEKYKKTKMVLDNLSIIFNERFDVADTLLKTYKILEHSIGNIQNIHNIYKNNHSELNQNIDKKQNESNISDRMSYYEYQKLDYLKRLYGWLFIIYFILVILIGINIIRMKTYTYKNIGIFCMLLIYPYVIHPIIGNIYYILTQIATFIWKIYWSIQ